MGEDLSPRSGFGLEHMLICPAASGLRVEAGLQGDRTKGGCSGWTRVTGHCTSHSRGLGLGTLELPSFFRPTSHCYLIQTLQQVVQIFSHLALSCPDGCFTVPHPYSPITVLPSLHPIPTTSSSYHHHLCPSVWVPSLHPYN